MISDAKVFKLNQWANLIRAANESGMNRREWCVANHHGRKHTELTNMIKDSTYLYQVSRLKTENPVHQKIRYNNGMIVSTIPTRSELLVCPSLKTVKTSLKF